MKEICLSYESGYTFKAYAIRYFLYKNNKYLIYTLNEKDEREYIKLYVVKVMKELGTFVTQTVRRTDEWKTMKGLIKRILGELKKGKLKIITDLDIEEIDKIVIYENRHFLLASDLVKILSSTPELEKIENEKQITILNVDINNTQTDDAENISPLSVPPLEEKATENDEKRISEPEIIKLHNLIDISPEEPEILELDDEEIMELDDSSEEILDLQDSSTEEVLELNEEKKEEMEVLDI